MRRLILFITVTITGGHMTSGYYSLPLFHSNPVKITVYDFAYAGIK